MKDDVKTVKEDRFMLSVKVGPKGQITIPALARKMFSINEGDTLIMAGDIKRGIALVKSDELYKFFGGVFEDGGDRDKGTDKKI